MAKKQGSIIYDTSVLEIPLYPCWLSTFSSSIKVEKNSKILLAKDVSYKIIGMSNGRWSKAGREKHWLIQTKHDLSADEFWIKEKDLRKLVDKGFII